MSITTLNPGSNGLTAPTVRAESGQDRTNAPNTGAQAASKPSSAPVGPAGLGDAVSRMQDYAQSIKRNLDFRLDDSSGRVVVQVINGDSGELIRQIPSEEVLELASRLEEARSLLVKEQA